MGSISEKKQIVIGFAGDSGDGVQLIGHQFTEACAHSGNDIQTFSDFPAEIRAPLGTLAGVSGFQLQFSSYDIHTPGDCYDTLIAFNPAALQHSVAKLKAKGTLIVDSDTFKDKEFKKANLNENPLHALLDRFQVVQVPMTSLVLDALSKTTLSRSKQRKCKNFFALGLVYWLYQRDLIPTQNWIKTKFNAQIDLSEANLISLQAGYHYGETIELLQATYVPKATLPSGTYRQVTGNEALCLGAMTAQYQLNRPLFVAGYPITPASDLLHWFSANKVKTFQAEDEMAAIGAALGASYGGSLGLTSTSGPGMDLKAETIGLAVMTELPLVIVDVQRAGPSTGMPTKVEQSDLLMALFGRHGECPVPVIAAQSPADCYATMLEAFHIATEFMTPVIVLSDAFLANSAEPWAIPTLSQSMPAQQSFPKDQSFQPYQRNTKGARPWVVPGTPGFEHRIGGLEKHDQTGAISYDGDNHQNMVMQRQAKVQAIAKTYPKVEPVGAKQGDCLIVGWGSTYGVLFTALNELLPDYPGLGFVHLRHLAPLPNDLGAVLANYRKVLVFELNSGQLTRILRADYLIDAKVCSKLKGQPLTVEDVRKAIQDEMECVA